MNNFYFNIRTLVILFSSILLVSCANKKNLIHSGDSAFFSKIEQYKNSPQSVNYNSLWEAYLDSTQAEDSATKHDKYLQALSKVQSGEIDCQEVNWNEIIESNYWSIKPHLTAANCLSQNNELTKAAFHRNFVEFILQGVFASGSGTHYYNAYKAASWGDIEDIIELAGYKSIDHYLRLIGANQGVYYVVIVEDAETGIQQEIYFDNINFLNSALGYGGRFGSRELTLGLAVASSLAEHNSQAAVAYAQIFTQDEQYENAAKWYLKATLLGSSVAYLKLVQLCLKDKITDYSDEVCLEFLGKAAEAGYGSAFVLLSALYREGIWVSKDIQIANDFLDIAVAKKGKGNALSESAELYYNGYLGEHGYKKADSWFKKAIESGTISDQYVLSIISKLPDEKLENDNNFLALESLAEKGNALAQTVVGARYLIDSSYNEDRGKIDLALNYIRKPAEQGLPRAQFTLAKLFEYGIGYSKDEAKAMEWYYKAGNSWHAEAQYNYAQYLNDSAYNLNPNEFFTASQYEDMSVEQMLKEMENNKYYAYDWMLSSARQANHNAMVSLGYYHEHGMGTPKNLQQAISFYKLSAELGNATGTYNYAYMLAYGKGIEINLIDAKKYFLLAHDMGSQGAANELGLMYLKGNGVTQSEAEAFKWFKLSAERKYMWAQFNLAALYEEGKGIEQNLDKAKEWYARAANQGHLASKQKLFQLSKS